MALQRLLFMIDMTYPDDRVLLYEAAGEEDLAAAFRRLHPTDAATRPEEVARLTGLNLIDPKFWAVVDADLIHAKAESLAHGAAWPPVPGAIPEQTQAFLAQSYTSVDRFIAYCDVPLAQAWLRRARECIVSARTKRRRYESGESVTAQAEDEFADGGVQRAVDESYVAVNNFFCALNLHPWCVAKWRLLLERMYVENSGVTVRYQGITATRPKPPPLLDMTSLGEPGDPICQYPLDPYETSVGPWRAYYWRWLSSRGMIPNAATRVFFGSPADVRDATRDLRNPDDCLRRFADGEPPKTTWAGVGAPSSGCVSSPRDNVLTLWLGNNGLAGGQNYGWASGAPYGTGPACGQSLFCPGVIATDSPGLLDADVTTQYVYTLFGWHLDMIDEFVAYLETMTPFEVMVRARIDATGKNLWTANHFGPSVLSGTSVAAFLAQGAIAAGDSERAQTDSLISAVGGAVSSVLSATPLGPLGAAIGGAGTAIAVFFNHVVDHTPPVDYQSDVFGRVEPAMEVFLHTPLGSASAADRDLAMSVMPPRPTGYTDAEGAPRYGWQFPPPAATPLGYAPIQPAAPVVFKPLLGAAASGVPSAALAGASAGSKAAACLAAAMLAGAISYAVAKTRAERRRREEAGRRARTLPPGQGAKPAAPATSARGGSRR